MFEIIENIRNDLENSPEIVKDKNRNDMKLAEAIIKDSMTYPPRLLPDVDEMTILNRLRQSKLAKPVYRRYWINLSENLCERILGLNDDLMWIRENKKKLLDLGKTDLTAKIFWLVLLKIIESNEEQLPWDETLVHSLQLLSPRFRARHFRQIVKESEMILYGANITAKRTTEDAASLLQYLETLINTDISSQEELEDLKSGLSRMHETLTSIFQSFIEELDLVKNLSVRNFISTMNTENSGFLLDMVFRALSSPEQGLETEFVQLFGQFLRMNEINPIFPLGRMQMEKSQLPMIDYIGSPFDGDDEKKLVEISAPGWRYKDHIISKARAVEVIENEQ